MNAVNPYAPPQAAVRDIETSDAFQPVRMWSSQGRIGRLRLLAYTTGAYFVLLAVMFVVGLISGAARLQVLVPIASALTAIPYLVFFVMKLIQRSHDMGWSGWTCILAFVPILNFIWIFKGGTKGTNAYGAPPPPNTLGVRLLGLWFPVVFTVAIVGIIAAIALPAYQHYKARAVQTR